MTRQKRLLVVLNYLATCLAFLIPITGKVFPDPIATAPAFSFLRCTCISTPAVAALALALGPAAGRCFKEDDQVLQVTASANSLIRMPRSLTTLRVLPAVILATMMRPAHAPRHTPLSATTWLSCSVLGGAQARGCWC